MQSSWQLGTGTKKMHSKPGKQTTLRRCTLSYIKGPNITYRNPVFELYKECYCSTHVRKPKKK